METLTDEERDFMEAAIEIGYLSGEAEVDMLSEKVGKPKDYVAEVMENIGKKILKIDEEYNVYREKTERAMNNLKEVWEESRKELRRLRKDLYR